MTKKIIPFVDLYGQYISIKEEIDAAIQNVINSSAFIRGSFVENFENEFSKLLGIKHTISCGNGTDSLYIAMRALGVIPGDEVIVPAHSWISTSETVTQAGGKVVFCDTNADTFTINTKLIEAKISANTVGIIPVHLYGQPADMDEIMAIAKKHNLWVLEDCAQAHLATYKGQKVGSIGDAGSFSFYPGKNLGAMGDAGAIITNDDNLATRMAMYCRHGGLTKGEHQIEGINSRMDGLQAAILSVKLPHLEGWNKKRIVVADYYEKYLVNKQLALPFTKDGRTHVWHLYVVKSKTRDSLLKKLRRNGVMASINYPIALPFLPAYSYLNSTKEDFLESYKNQLEIISLPIYPELLEEDVIYIASLVD
ncbi:DegT/DnrJ/EryC1/StrS aminotransferase family protein [Polynucleobacter sp. AP-Feld-500C-C5]|uniref:DegT/DnrJ/EryC1/StrS family aminotransferase n=1 Tax=Polynucleobacter sp. AP-Feld-500C-C5 TaxID=2576924 RepID=UPI001C0C788C|nr:DegT/DnrJ/EryC1/StrS family aminotransferase [Polynucleobacter sp. AP-Feld-500C-C5]MBU3632886.1 DegT/DnrJ/EryC1/StrS family aminotransferase [Polynucleobacter sp. AP-Feld-500C-C5]